MDMTASESHSGLLTLSHVVETTEPKIEITINPNLSSCAKRIVKDVLRLKQGENLTIETWEHELPFAKEVSLEARKAGANVLLVLESDDTYFRLVDEGHEKSIGRIGSHEWSLLKNSDAFVFFPGPADIQRQSKLSAKKREGSTAYNHEWYRTASKSGLRGVRIRTAYATPSRADMMGFDLQKWRANLFEAIDVDYGAIDRVGKKIAKTVWKGRNIRITAPGGTNLKMRTSGVSPHLYSGVRTNVPHYNIYSSMMNIPGSELDFAPNSRSVEGSVYFNLPAYSGNERIEGLRWRFESGRLREFSADRNIEAFSKPFSKAKGQKDRVGVVIIGLAPKLSFGFGTQNLNVAGALTIGIGSFGEGDKNKTSYQFFGTISGATLELDGRKLVDGGSLVANLGRN